MRGWGRCFKVTLQTCVLENFRYGDGGRAEGLVCADPGAKTPIGPSGFYNIIAPSY
jgi:hypothetical protein